jgi:sec-independent protein translocase protein TatB
MLGLSFDKLLIIGVVAVFLLGPERLPYYASQLAKLVRGAKAMAEGAKARMREEMGPDFDEVDWKKLDPRQYDPRRIIREALIDDAPAAVSVPTPPVGESAYARRQRRLAESGGAGESVVGAAGAPTVAAASARASGSTAAAPDGGPVAGAAAPTHASSVVYDEEAT